MMHNKEPRSCRGARDHRMENGERGSEEKPIEEKKYLNGVKIPDTRKQGAYLFLQEHLFPER